MVRGRFAPEAAPDDRPRIAPEILAKGFDGLFLDNVDMIETRNHTAQRAGMRQLVWQARRPGPPEGGCCSPRTAPWGLSKLGLLDAIDGWNREDVTWTYDFDRRRYVHQRPGATGRPCASCGHGRARPDHDGHRLHLAPAMLSAAAESIANACSAGALPYVGDIGLTARRLPSPPLTCP